MQSILIATALAAALILYKITSILLTRQRRNRKAKELGCQRAVRFPTDPFGYQNVRDMLKADKEKRMPDFQIERLEGFSKKIGRVAHTQEVAMPIARTFIVTFEPKNIQTVLALKFKDWKLAESRIANFGPLLGTGIFASNGKQWEHSRALLRPQFVRDQVSDLDLEERHVQNMMLAIKTDSSPSGEEWTPIIDIMPLFFRLTLDSATEFLFGESVDSQLNELQGSARKVPEGLNEIDFAYSFDQSQAGLASASRMGDLWWLAHSKTFKKDVSKVHRFIDHYVKLALNKPADKSGDNERYVFLEGLAAQTRDPIELRDQLLNILLAGRDTTASLLSWFFRILALNPDVFARLRKEITNEFGSYAQPKEITFSALKSSQYLQWCLNEALRLFPVVPLNSREAVRDTVLPTGGGPDGTSPIFITKGQEMLYSIHVVHRRKDIWGADADEFKPERWDGRRPGWEYLPFNGGPRICIGQQFALTEAAYVIVRLLQRFDGIDASSIDKNVIKHGLTLINCPADGVRLRFRAAKA